jgi:hypothetical protein
LGTRKAPSHNRPRAGSDAEQHERNVVTRRAAILSQRDAAYRRALGLGRHDRIPARLGQCQRTGAPRSPRLHLAQEEPVT